MQNASPSARAQLLPASAIRKYVPLSDALKNEGVHVFHLNIGQPDVATSKKFFEAILAFDRPVVAYENSAGNADLRSAIAKYYDGFSLVVKPEHCIVTAGGSEALMMALAVTCDPGDEIIVPEPYYTNYNTFALQNQVTIVPYPTTIGENFALKDLTKLEALVTDRTKAILVCTPNNPTGAVLSREELEIVCDVAMRHKLFVISDEVYREFVYDGDDAATSVLSIDGMDELAIVTDSISKRYSVCGGRVGWIVSRNSEIIKNILKYAQSRLSVATLEQIAAVALLRDGKDDIARAKDEYDARRKLVHSALTNAGLTCGYPKGALYLMVDLGVDADAFTQYMLTDYPGIKEEKETVMITPAKSFYKTEGMGTTQARIAFVLEISKLEKAMSHLIRGLSVFASYAK